MKQSQYNIVFVDDDAIELARFRQLTNASPAGISWETTTYHQPEEFVQALSAGSTFEIVVLDLHFDNSDRYSGIDLTAIAREKLPNALIIVRSSDVAKVGAAFQAGADDYLDKYGTDHDLFAKLPEAYRNKQKNCASGTVTYPFPIIGPAMRQIAARVPKLIDSAVGAIHISGASGTGKEVVASLFKHICGKQPFVKVNCAAISKDLLESELFGHVKGSFTGASHDRVGLIEASAGGFLYLDEVAELTPKVQAALLVALETGEFSRVGESARTRMVKFRVLSATNENLEELVRAGKFRLDLWQRLCQAEIELVPLAQRQGEITELAQHFAATADGGPYQLTAPVLNLLQGYTWANGNVRELRNCIRSMTENSVDQLLTPISIPGSIWKRFDRQRGPDPASQATEHASNQVIPGGPRLVIDLPELSDQWLAMKDIYDHAFLAYLRFINQKSGRQSLRKLNQVMGLSRNTISPKIKSCVAKGMISREEAKTLVEVDL